MDARVGPVPQSLNSLPDALGRHVPIGKLGHRLDAGKAVPELNRPLVVGASQVGELLFGRKYGCLAGCLLGSVDGDYARGGYRRVFQGRVISLPGVKTAAIASIDPKCLKGKAITQWAEDGEGLATMPAKWP